MLLPIFVHYCFLACGTPIHPAFYPILGFLSQGIFHCIASPLVTLHMYLSLPSLGSLVFTAQVFHLSNFNP